MSTKGPSRRLGLGGRIFAGGALAGFLLFAAAPQVRADRERDCQKRIAKADHRLHEAIEHHGYRSEQAERAHHELTEERQRCWDTYHRWWDEDEHRWHTDRDWRDDDHEHYRDH
jgi:hypothetical protein